MKTFIIDDDPISNMVTELMLRINGFSNEITIFESAEEALLRLNSTEKDQLPELILLDINMPLVDGWQFLEMLSHGKTQLEASFSIFILTSSLDNDDMRKADTYKPMVLDFLQKPITEESLDVIRQHLSV